MVLVAQHISGLHILAGLIHPLGNEAVLREDLLEIFIADPGKFRKGPLRTAPAHCNGDGAVLRQRFSRKGILAADAAFGHRVVEFLGGHLQLKAVFAALYLLLDLLIVGIDQIGNSLCRLGRTALLEQLG